jgi:DNA-binding transcriptional ArsR family regulator
MTVHVGQRTRRRFGERRNVAEIRLPPVSHARLARIGTLLGDETRALLLSVLMDGRARTGRELARHSGVAASTASEHLSRLIDGGMVRVDAQGRHRYSGSLARKSPSCLRASARRRCPSRGLSCPAPAPPRS